MSDGVAPGFALRYTSMARPVCSPRRSVTRFRMPFSSRENAASSLESVISVRVVPIITGTFADTADAVGKYGCCDTALPSMVGENPTVI
jgi:hypothetical protein